MKKSDRILIAVIADVFFVLIFNCLYGFCIGGKIGFYGNYKNNIIYFSFAIVAALIAMILNFVFICGKDTFSDKKKVQSLLLFAVLVASVMAATYAPLNTISADKDAVEYESVITEINNYKSIVSYDLSFIDNKGEEISTTLYFGNVYQDFGDDRIAEKGTQILVREKNGGFNFPVYDITFVFE